MKVPFDSTENFYEKYKNKNFVSNRNVVKTKTEPKTIPEKTKNINIITTPQKSKDKANDEE
jgi:hypothetical protein